MICWFDTLFGVNIKSNNLTKTEKKIWKFLSQNKDYFSIRSNKSILPEKYDDFMKNQVMILTYYCFIFEWLCTLG